MKMNYGAVSKLSETLGRMSGLTGEAGLAIAKTKRAIRKDVEVFEELRTNMVRKYGQKKDDDSIAVKPGDKNWPQFLAEYKELFDRTVDVELCQLDDVDLDKIYCESATADDYEVFEMFMVKPKEVRNEKEAETGEAPAEHIQDGDH